MKYYHFPKSLLYISFLLLCSVSGPGFCYQGLSGENIRPRGFTVGIAAHLLRKNVNYIKALDEIKRSGASSVRFSAPWGQIELSKGKLEVPKKWDEVVEAARKRGLRVLMIFGYGNKWYQDGQKPTDSVAVSAFVRYAKFVATHFKGDVYAYEVWNEWDGRSGHTLPGNATSYVSLLKSVYPVVKSADPGALVLSGGITSKSIRNEFLDNLIKDGVLSYADGISLHPYIHCAKSSNATAWGRWMERVERKLRRRAGKAVPIYVTEIGWPTSLGKCGVSESVQSKRVYNVLIRAYKLPFIKGIWWYDLEDVGDSPFDQRGRFGLMKTNGSMKSSFFGFERAAKEIANAENGE